MLSQVPSKTLGTVTLAIVECVLIRIKHYKCTVSYRLKVVKQWNGGFPQPAAPITLNNMLFEYHVNDHISNSISGQLSSEQLAEGRIPRSELETGKILAKIIPRTYFQGLNFDSTPFKDEYATEITRYPLFSLIDL